MPELINPITGGVLGVSEELAPGFIARGYREKSAEPDDKPAEAPAPKRGRPRKAEADRD